MINDGCYALQVFRGLKFFTNNFVPGSLDSVGLPKSIGRVMREQISNYKLLIILDVLMNQLAHWICQG